jgi:glycine betaine/proline transport system permease protein
MMANKTIDWLNPFASVDLGLSSHADGIKQRSILNRDPKQPTKRLQDGIIGKIEAGMQAVPPLVMLALLVLIAWAGCGATDGLVRRHRQARCRMDCGASGRLGRLAAGGPRGDLTSVR